MLCRNLLKKQASTWEDVMREIESRDATVHMLDPVYENAFYFPFDYEIDGEKIKAGDIGYAYEEKKPGTLAHELGHKLVDDSASSLYKNLTLGSRIATQGDNPFTNLNVLLPLLSYGLSWGTGNPYWLLGGSGLGAATAVPTIVDEYRASAKGAEILKNLNAPKEDVDSAYSGVKSYIENGLTVPALGLLGSGAWAALM